MVGCELWNIPFIHCCKLFTGEFRLPRFEPSPCSCDGKLRGGLRLRVGGLSDVAVCASDQILGLAWLESVLPEARPITRTEVVGKEFVPTGDVIEFSSLEADDTEPGADELWLRFSPRLFILGGAPRLAEFRSSSLHDFKMASFSSRPVSLSDPTQSKTRTEK